MKTSIIVIAIATLVSGCESSTKQVVEASVPVAQPSSSTVASVTASAHVQAEDTAPSTVSVSSVPVLSTPVDGGHVQDAVNPPVVVKK